MLFEGGTIFRNIDTVSESYLKQSCIGICRPRKVDEAFTGAPVQSTLTFASNGNCCGSTKMAFLSPTLIGQPNPSTKAINASIGALAIEQLMASAEWR